ncbi:MAG: hypothetical protein SFV54_13870 [Bryobacteraceae bacterium]|nr:hypothetical protein [Bryobacteraceae bacterium]
MDLTIVLLVILLVAAVGAGLWYFTRQRKSQELQGRFGPEYEEAVRRHGDRTRAESELAGRMKRRERFDIHPLSEADRDHFASLWRHNQAHFVDDPSMAITEADHLVMELMRARGYPMSDFDRRADDLSVDYPHVVRNYRAAHGIALRHARGEANTEDLRMAMVSYRDLFAELLEPNPVREEVRR